MLTATAPSTIAALTQSAPITVNPYAQAVILTDRNPNSTAPSTRRLIYLESKGEALLVDWMSNDHSFSFMSKSIRKRSEFKSYGIVESWVPEDCTEF